VKVDGYFTDHITRYAVDFIESKSTNPFFLAILALLQGRPFSRPGTLHWEDQYNMAVRKGEWKLVHQFFAAKPYLYDISKDIGENNNVADAQPRIVKELQAAHAAWRQRHYPNPIPHTRNRSNYIFPQR
jgi:hypothetical protein